MKKKVIFGVSVFIALFSIILFEPHEIFAGTNTCSFSASAGGCRASNINCATDETPNNAYCQGFSNQQTCNSAPATNCLTSSQTTSACVVATGVGCVYQPNTFRCSTGSGLGTKIYCCSSQTACDQVTQGTPTGNALIGKVDPTCNGTGIDSAIGCIDFKDTNNFMGSIFRWAAGLGGGIAFLLILLGGFSVMTSAGNPERLKDGQAIISAAVSGLVLLILCIFLLKFIGIDILGLNQFGFGK